MAAVHEPRHIAVLEAVQYEGRGATAVDSALKGGDTTPHSFFDKKLSLNETRPLPFESNAFRIRNKSLPE